MGCQFKFSKVGIDLDHRYYSQYFAKAVTCCVLLFAYMHYYVLLVICI